MTSDADHHQKDGIAAREAEATRRERAADEREAALLVRETLAEMVLVANDDRGATARRILYDADHRDEVSDARDVDADDREGAASREAFLDDSGHGSSHHAPGVRRAAALDRRHSKTDRASAATDRVELAGEDPATDTGTGDSPPAST